MMKRINVMAAVGVSAWLIALFGFFQTFLAKPTDFAFVTGFIVEEIAYFALWVAAWTWITKVHRGKLLLAEHLCIAACFAFLDAAVLSALMPWIFFVAGWPWPIGLDEINRALMISVAALTHVKWVSRTGLSSKIMLLWAAASSIAIALVAANIWAENNDAEAVNRLGYLSNIYPPVLLSPPSHNVETGLRLMWDRPWGDEKPSEQKSQVR
jgi:hypothetical protein